MIGQASESGAGKMGRPVIVKKAPTIKFADGRADSIGIGKKFLRRRQLPSRTTDAERKEWR